jgi:hypothetical protein
MIKRSNNLKVTATWMQSEPASDRWQELHAMLSRSPTTAAYGWARRSSMFFKWRGLPASVSTLRTTG